MPRSRRSRTAQGVAAERAVLSTMGVLADPLARTMLSPSMTTVVGIARHLPAAVLTRSVTLAGLAARVLWFDARVTDALDAGITQVAAIGAGYDSRPWRLHRDGVSFFELDEPGTQREKMDRAPGQRPVYVGADLRRESAGDAMAAHGLDPKRPALFVMEGVTMYLEEQTVRDQLAGLAASGGAGSRLAVDFYPPPAAGTTRHHRQNRLQRLARVGSGESLRLTLAPAAARALVTGSGWEVTESTSLRHAARALVPVASGLPVDAVNADKTLIAARRR
ncbi:MAG: class I SAM-dependent methyltransferase [Acidimicrobiales bacterium]